MNPQTIPDLEVIQDCLSNNTELPAKEYDLQGAEINLGCSQLCLSGDGQAS